MRGSMGWDGSRYSVMERNIEKSRAAFEKAQKLIPGGVNSPVRAFKSVGGDPLFIDRAKGARVWDIDGNSYVDFVASWGPMILGHAREEIVQAVQQAAERGTSYGAPTLLETEKMGRASCREGLDHGGGHGR